MLRLPNPVCHIIPTNHAAVNAACLALPKPGLQRPEGWPCFASTRPASALSGDCSAISVALAQKCLCG
jgi:hypothetical protein